MDQYPPGQYPQSGNASLRGMQTTTSMNLVFFGAAGCVMFAACIAGIALLYSLELVDFLQMCYLFMFGAVLAVLDTPFFKTIKAMGDLKMYIGKYVNLLTRVTGKGVTFVFVGSALFSAMWDNLEGGFMLFLSVVLCAFPTAVGFIAIVIGIMKSQKLSKARKHVAMGALEQRYDQWAQTYRGATGGLTPAEFNGLTMENGGFKWEDADLKLIFNALVSNPAWRINSASQYQGGKNFGIIMDPLNQTFETYTKNLCCSSWMNLIICALVVGTGYAEGKSNTPLLVAVIVVAILFIADFFVTNMLRGKLEPEIKSGADIQSSVTLNILSSTILMVVYFVYKILSIKEILEDPNYPAVAAIAPAILIMVIRISKVGVAISFKKWVQKWHTDFGGPGFRGAGDPREQSLQRA